MKFLSYIPSFLKNKYFLATIIFVVLLLFFDKNDVFNQIDHYRELKDLKESRNYYKQQIELTKFEIEQLKTNPDFGEKLAREKYYMKRDNEDVFIIEEHRQKK